MGLTASIALTCGLAACSGAPGENTTNGADAEVGFVPGSGATNLIPESDRKVAPELAGETLDGERLSVSDYRGKVVVVNIWGSWCPPCREEMPDLVAASKALADDGVAFVGINTRDTNIVPARQFVKKKGVDYPSIYDPSGRVLLKLRDTVPPTAIPSTLVIDAEGRIAATIFGAATRKTFEQLALDVAGGQ